ncbi:hypothetical protein ABH972_003089 [Bradyrhizobium ottawaense]
MSVDIVGNANGWWQVAPLWWCFCLPITLTTLRQTSPGSAGVGTRANWMGWTKITLKSSPPDCRGRLTTAASIGMRVSFSLRSVVRRTFLAWSNMTGANSIPDPTNGSLSINLSGKCSALLVFCCRPRGSKSFSRRGGVLPRPARSGSHLRAAYLYRIVQNEESEGKWRQSPKRQLTSVARGRNSINILPKG